MHCGSTHYLLYIYCAADTVYVCTIRYLLYVYCAADTVCTIRYVVSSCDEMLFHFSLILLSNTGSLCQQWSKLPRSPSCASLTRPVYALHPGAFRP